MLLRQSRGLWGVYALPTGLSSCEFTVDMAVEILKNWAKLMLFDVFPQFA